MKKTVAIRIDKALWDSAGYWAEEEGTSRVALIETALVEFCLHSESKARRRERDRRRRALAASSPKSSRPAAPTT